MLTFACLVRICRTIARQMRMLETLDITQQRQNMHFLDAGTENARSPPAFSMRFHGTSAEAASQVQCT